MRRTALFILIFSLLGATGCTGVLSKKQQEVNAMGNEVELTQEKKDFLTAMSMDEERVQAGKLYDWQIEALAAVRLCNGLSGKEVSISQL